MLAAGAGGSGAGDGEIAELASGPEALIPLIDNQTSLVVVQPEVTSLVEPMVGMSRVEAQ